MNGGALIAQILKNHHVSFLFTLCGGHISPILVECKRYGIQVIDVRDEANAVFAADATARLTGIPGVAAVTAGPGVTNTITALKNAQMAQSPLILFGGATATILKNRGSLQDIDQQSLIKPLVKWSISIRTLRQLGPALETAFYQAQSGVPGPVFIEVPVDLLYDESLVREWYQKESGVEKAKGIGGQLLKSYLGWHLYRQFRGANQIKIPVLKKIAPQFTPPSALKQAIFLLQRAKKPVLVIGSQTVLEAKEIHLLANAIKKIGIPTYLGGMARGLLGQENTIQFRHQRNVALKNADLVFVAGFPFDFRLGYGKSISKKADVIAINRNPVELSKNRRPTLGICADAGLFLQQLAQSVSFPENQWSEWFQQLRENEKTREEEIQKKAEAVTEYLNPVAFCRALDQALDEKSILVADGGDFVATASYILRPRAPLSWLDPGVFGTLGVGGGFALGAKLCQPHSEIWILYGDGSAGYTLMEFDTFVRHKIPIIAVVGNDACWSQIAREQNEILKDDVGTVLRRSDYHLVADALGGKGFLLNAPEDTERILKEAKQCAHAGTPVLINVYLGKTDFRKGSISM